jgi:protoporphyrin/coproporphyrin ferrochelatase
MNRTFRAGTGGPRNRTATSREGVLLCALGSPGSLDEVEGFLRGVRRGRPTPPELIAEIRERYSRIGGGSPLGRISRDQAAELEARLGENGFTGPCRYGAVIGTPSVEDALGELTREGARNLTVVPLTPYYSRWGVGTYLARVRSAVRALPLGGRVRYVTGWHLEPALVEAFATRVRSLRADLARRTGRDPLLLFTAHSLPVRATETRDVYVRSLEETRRAILSRLSGERFLVAYQSAGRSEGPWLGPSVESVIEDPHLAAGGGIALVPYGFIADNLEILYDLDVVLRERAAARGLVVERIPSLNADPQLIEALASAVEGRAPPHGGREF